MKEKKWHKLDNVGKFYASTAEKDIPNVFRYSASLYGEIDKDILQQALDETVKVFPSFNVNLKRGLFWYYLDETSKRVEVVMENLPICFRLYNNSDDFLYRVSYFKDRINFEISHILSDGRGSVEFFKMLIGNYVKIKHSLDDVDLITKASQSEKEEDSFSKYYKKTKSTNSKTPKIYFYKNKRMKNSTRFMESHMSLSKVLDLSHKYNVTLTTLFVTILIYSFKDEMKVSDMDKSIKIDLPIDLRNYFKSSSTKNFFGLTSIIYKFNNKDDTFEEVLKSVKEQIKDKTTVEKLSERVNMMVAFEKNIFCRIIPIFIKNIALKLIDKFTSQMSTSCISNVGKITFNKDIEKHIKEINILTSTTNFQFTICSFKDDLSIGISSKYKSNEVIKNFCRFFTEEDIDMVMNISEVD